MIQKHIKRNGKVDLWDMGPAKDDPAREKWEKQIGPHQVELWSVDAQHALEVEPDRFKHELPKGVKAGPKQEVVERERAEAQNPGGQPDPHYGDRT